MEYNDRQFSNPHHHHHLLNNFTYTRPINSHARNPSSAPPTSETQSPPLIPHTKASGSRGVRLGGTYHRRMYKDALPISSSPAAHPSNPCAITAPCVSSHPTRDGVIVCDLLHDLARSVYNNTHSLIRHRRLPSHWNSIRSHATWSKVISHVDLLIRKFGLP